MPAPSKALVAVCRGRPNAWRCRGKARANTRRPRGAVLGDDSPRYAPRWPPQTETSGAPSRTTHTGAGLMLSRAARTTIPASGQTEPRRRDFWPRSTDLVPHLLRASRREEWRPVWSDKAPFRSVLTDRPTDLAEERQRVLLVPPPARPIRSRGCLAVAVRPSVGALVLRL